MNHPEWFDSLVSDFDMSQYQYECEKDLIA